jgi:hypothetical protein
MTVVKEWSLVNKWAHPDRLDDMHDLDGQHMKRDKTTTISRKPRGSCILPVHHVYIDTRSLHVCMQH